jgi:hypothetical protein
VRRGWAPQVGWFTSPFGWDWATPGAFAFVAADARHGQVRLFAYRWTDLVETLREERRDEGHVE